MRLFIVILFVFGQQLCYGDQPPRKPHYRPLFLKEEHSFFNEREMNSKFSLDTLNSLQAINLGFTMTCYAGKKYTLKRAAGLMAKYGHYGCWCGSGGSGRTVDSLDKCCKGHDICLVAAAKRHGKSTWTFKTSAQMTYKSTCTNRAIHCHGKGLSYEACICDKVFARCWNKNKSKWRWWNAWIFARDDC